MANQFHWRCSRVRRAWKGLPLWLVWLCVVLSACQPASRPVAAPPRPTEQPRDESRISLPDARYEIEQPTLEQQDEQGRTLWRLEARALRAETKDEQARGVLLTVRGWLYRNGKPVLEFRAPYARADAEARTVEAWGKVVALSKTHDARLEAGRILWKAREDRIYAREGILLKWGAFELRERAIVVDTALEQAWGEK